MKSLVQYINEWKKDYIEDFGRICINSIDINVNDSAEKLKKKINEGILESWSKFLIARVSIIEEYNKTQTNKRQAQKDAALKDAEKYWLKYKESKPGILKRSPEKQQEWLNDKLKKSSEEFDNNPWNKFIPIDASVKPDKLKLTYCWYGDLTGHSHKSGIKEDRMIYILNDIIDTLKKYPDATYSKLKKIVVATDSFTNRWGDTVFDIFPVFDDETEDRLEKERYEFGQRISKEYYGGGAGHWTGD